MLADAEGEEEVAELLAVGGSLRDRAQLVGADPAGVAGLGEQAGGDGADGEAGLGRVGEAAGEEEAEVLLAGEDGLGGLVGVGGDDGFGEDGGDALGGFGVERCG